MFLCFGAVVYCVFVLLPHLDRFGSTGVCVWRLTVYGLVVVLWYDWFVVCWFRGACLFRVDSLLGFMLGLFVLVLLLEFWVLY